MMMQEFIARTGFTPTFEEYREIEQRYCAFDGDKDAFCKAFDPQEIIDRRAGKIGELESSLVEERKAAKKREEELLKRIAELQSDLDDELGWEPCKDMGTAVSQEDYLKLAKGNKPMTDEEAKDLVCGEFGFDKGKIEIIREVHTYEANKHRHTRKAASFRRDPYYEATDWFYVRFNVKGYTTWQWEADGLELKPYCT